MKWTGGRDTSGGERWTRTRGKQKHSFSSAYMQDTTNAYEFKLITLLVVDEYGEGFTVAWCIANREDRVLLIEFFTSIRTKCGMVRPQWFMSDMADQYHHVSVFDDSP